MFIDPLTPFIELSNFPSNHIQKTANCRTQDRFPRSKDRGSLFLASRINVHPKFKNWRFRSLGIKKKIKKRIIY